MSFLFVVSPNQPASSPHLVSEVKRLKSDPAFYGEFLDHSHQCVEYLIHAFKTNNIKGVQKMIRQNRAIIRKAAPPCFSAISHNDFNLSVSISTDA
jgi:ERG8-type phosphomevalonate kinase